MTCASARVRPEYGFPLSYSYHGPTLDHECQTDSHHAAQASWLSLHMLLHCLKLPGRA